jgi:hypothetical protein
MSPVEARTIFVIRREDGDYYTSSGHMGMWSASLLNAMLFPTQDIANKRAGQLPVRVATVVALEIRPVWTEYPKLDR